MAPEDTRITSCPATISFYTQGWALAAAVFLVVYFKGNWLRRRITQCGMEPEVR